MPWWGCAVDHVHAGTGLVGIRERGQALAGNAEIESVSGQGTQLEVRLPLRVPAGIAPSAQQEAELREQNRQRDNALQLSTRGAQAAVLLIFLDAPLPAVILAVGVGLFGYLRLRLVSTQLAFNPTTGAKVRIPIYQQHGLLAGILALCAVCLWYIPVAQHAGYFQIGTLPVLVFSLLLGVPAFIECLRWYRGIDRYLLSLPRREREDAIGRRHRDVSASLGLWIVIIAFSALFLPPSPAVPPHTLSQWADDVSIVILAVWPLLDGVDYLLSTCRRRLLSPMAT